MGKKGEINNKEMACFLKFEDQAHHQWRGIVPRWKEGLEVTIQGNK